MTIAIPQIPESNRAARSRIAKLTAAAGDAAQLATIREAITGINTYAQQARRYADALIGAVGGMPADAAKPNGVITGSGKKWADDRRAAREAQKASAGKAKVFDAVTEDTLDRFEAEQAAAAAATAAPIAEPAPVETASQRKVRMQKERRAAARAAA